MRFHGFLKIVPVGVFVVSTPGANCFGVDNILVAGDFFNRKIDGISRDYKKHVEVECIREALSEADGNITRAAELLGMKRPRLSQLIKEHGIALEGAL